jgi:hypothetical protein
LGACGRALALSLAGDEPLLALLLRGRAAGREQKKQLKARQDVAEAHRVEIPVGQKRVPKPKRTSWVWS